MSPTDASGLPAPQERKVSEADLAKVPAIQEVEKHLANQDYAGAVRGAFPLVMVDVGKAYNLTYPPHWTARDVLAHALRPDMGRLPDLLFQLYSLYEPVRYGLERDQVPGDVREIVRRIYTETALRSRIAPGESRRPAAVDSSRPSSSPPPPARPTFSILPADSDRAKSSEEGRPW